jgi:hypothetical protein
MSDMTAAAQRIIDKHGLVRECDCHLGKLGCRVNWVNNFWHECTRCNQTGTRPLLPEGLLAVDEHGRPSGPLWGVLTRQPWGLDCIDTDAGLHTECTVKLDGVWHGGDFRPTATAAIIRALDPGEA